MRPEATCYRNRPLFRDEVRGMPMPDTRPSSGNRDGAAGKDCVARLIGCSSALATQHWLAD